ncbi:Threonine/homoserine/homoserine lactone efflux protein [Lentzea xinjiangensis]|uniref:Threonine/homoserine/homoserine lactone efflux protein n=1 Tax=Lentzea xinjiangensis TaxID=402600 RepID=A0A1H9EN11_9PSEU|nr:LysE family translocator [Lentzea xinjiangensis]SEQ26398.1 Threonine/homoserine/homoserine lactone efflux protein [Lentzea xinjiangensis]
MPLENLVAFVAASFLIALSPGPGTAMVLRQSVHGRKAALATVFGMEVGVAGWALAAALGLSALLTASEIAYHGLRIAGAAFLIYLGVKALISKNLPAQEPPPASRAFRSGLVVNLANPKLGVFAISFLPQFLPAGQTGEGVLLFLAAFWVVIDTVWYLVIVSVLHTIRGWLGRPRVRAALEKLSGGVLLALGVRLVLDPR